MSSVEFSENLTKIISPRNLYNGSAGYVKGRNTITNQKKKKKMTDIPHARSSIKIKSCQ